MKIRLLVLFFGPLALHAQFLPDLRIPKLRTTEYDDLQAKTIAHTSTNFQLKGPVKEICEAIHVLKKNGEDSSACLKSEYLFSEKGKLVSYSEDSSTLRKGDIQDNRIINTYDSTGEILLETCRLTNGWRKSKTQIRFNNQGFREKEVYTCYGCSRDYRNQPIDDSVFDYTLNYQWTPDFDSVSLTYNYVKSKSIYQREKDIVRSFVYELNQKKKRPSSHSITTTGIFTFQTYQDEINMGKKNRITEWIIWDHAIKNSMNIHRKTEYAYNENDELTEIRHYSAGWVSPENNFQLEFKEEVTYISYDAYGNWTELEVRVRPQMQGSYYIRGAVDYKYKREISYY